MRQITYEDIAIIAVVLRRLESEMKGYQVSMKRMAWRRAYKFLEALRFEMPKYISCKEAIEMFEKRREDERAERKKSSDSM